jgi:putative transposase
MKRSRFSEEQIIGILKETEGSESIRGVCGRHNITEQGFFRWRRKFASSAAWTLLRRESSRCSSGRMRS